MTLPREIDALEIVDGEPTFAVVPWSGEALTLAELPVEQIARILDETREFEYDRLRAFKRELQEEILRRADERAEWTIHVEGWKLSCDSPNRSEWDVPALREALHGIVADGLLPAETASKAVKAEVTYKAVASGVNALLRLGGEVKDRIEACRLPSSKPRGVRVSRA